MTWQTEDGNKIKFRTYILFYVMVLFALLLFSRMFYLQVLEAGKYQTLADKNRIEQQYLAPIRGVVYDRNGKPLAYNQRTFKAVLTPEKATIGVKNVLDRFQKLIPLTEKEQKRILKEVSQKKKFMPVILKADLSFEQMAKVELNLPTLPGIMTEESLMRLYPLAQQGAHLIGYVSLLTEKDSLLGLNEEENRNLKKIPDMRLGRIGVEKQYNDDLFGKIGIKTMEINSVGRNVRQLEKQKPEEGKDIYLSIDSRFQEVGYEALRGESGATILMDIHSGEVLMLVSTPAFDPNMFNFPIDEVAWKELERNEKSPLMNKAIRGRYSPGSIFKIVVALAGLESGIITPQTRINCEGKLIVADHPFHCWKKSGHNSINLREALQYSCDVYFYEVARRVGHERIMDMAERLGFGEITQIGLEDELSGLLPTEMWKRANIHDDWRLGDTMNLGIGQGYLSATPLQMVQLMARVINGKKKVVPTLIKQKDASISSSWEDLGLKKYNLRVVKEGLSDVVNKAGGTAYHTRINVDGQTMAGKTATTQIRHISLKEREEGIKQQKDLAWKERDHAFFLAYAPVNNPRYALIVAVEHGGGGSSMAAPIASKIMRRVLEIDLEDKRQERLQKKSLSLKKQEKKE